MAVSLPYLSSYKNVPRLFASIATAKVPESFTQSFLSQTLGLKASGDRALIPLMRTLGFIDQSGRPTSAFRELKNPARAKFALADAVRRAYAPLYASNESVQALAPDALRGLIAQVAGTDEDMTKRIAWTFTALAKLGDFTNVPPAITNEETPDVLEAPDDGPVGPAKSNRANFGSSLRPEFHYNFQVHLPANGTEETYLNIFNALRKVFQ